MEVESSESGGEQPDPKNEKYRGLVERYNKSCELVDALKDKIDRAKEDTETTKEERDKILADYASVVTQRDILYDQLRDAEKLEQARMQHRPISLDKNNRYVVREPDIYTEHSEHSFFRDLYGSQLKHDPVAQQRINKH